MGGDEDDLDTSNIMGCIMASTMIGITAGWSEGILRPYTQGADYRAVYPAVHQPWRAFAYALKPGFTAWLILIAWSVTYDDAEIESYMATTTTIACIMLIFSFGAFVFLDLLIINTRLKGWILGVVYPICTFPTWCILFVRVMLVVGRPDPIVMIPDNPIPKYQVNSIETYVFQIYANASVYGEGLSIAALAVTYAVFRADGPCCDGDYTCKCSGFCCRRHGRCARCTRCPRTCSGDFADPEWLAPADDQIRV